MWSRVALILRFKLRVALKTYLNPANVFLLLLTTAGLWVLTRSLVAVGLESGFSPVSLLTLWFTGIWSLTTAAHLPIASRLLFRSPECELLLSQPLSPRHFLWERGVELMMPQLLWWFATGMFLYSWTDLSDASGLAAIAGLVAGLIMNVFCVLYQLLSSLVIGHLRGRSARATVAVAVTLLPWAPASFGGPELGDWAAALQGVFFWPSSAASLISTGIALGWLGAVALVLGVAGLAIGVDRAFGRWHRADYSAALARSQKARRRLWPWANSLLRPFPRSVRGLVTRDLALLVRGMYPSALLALVGLGAVHVLFAAAVRDPKDVRLALVMTQFFGIFEVVLVAWVFAFDWLKFRSEWLGLERSSPVAPRTMLAASLVTAVVPGLSTAASLGVLAIAVRPELMSWWPQLLISLGLVGGVIPALAVQAAWAGFRDRVIPEETAFGMSGGFTGMILVLATWLPPWIGLAGCLFLAPAVFRMFRSSLDCIRRLEVTW